MKRTKTPAAQEETGHYQKTGKGTAGRIRNKKDMIAEFLNKPVIKSQHFMNGWLSERRGEKDPNSGENSEKPYSSGEQGREKRKEGSAKLLRNCNTILWNVKHLRRDKALKNA